ncbi:MULTISPECIES: hypothetical protein [unclassified Sulfurospirillum]|uniref:hypothetical protein n=1 Tax=unclassified Sulfurospirillum TaxID=2618290 RepID=UPI000508D376|nr:MULTISPECIES: hypothetical protein [unclassified Sulfurospirillum]KFL34998.1 hypothetical protein JU57_03270 [Sulfurospirillum sp. SCADC]
MNSTHSLALEQSASNENYFGLFVTIGLFVIMLLMMNFIFSLILESYCWIKHKRKGEAYTVRFPNPVTAIKNRFIRAKNWLSHKIKQIQTAVQAVKDIQILIIETSGNEQLKHAFIAYTFIVALTATTAYNFLGLAFKYDFIAIFKQLF